MKAILLIVVCAACVSCAQTNQGTFSPHPVPLPVDLPKREPVRITWPPRQENEPSEITACRSIWPDAHVRNMNHGQTNRWHCLLVLHPGKTQLSEVLACRQALLEHGWAPQNPENRPPRAVPPKYKTASELFRKENLSLWFSFAEDTVKLKVRPLEK